MASKVAVAEAKLSRMHHRQDAFLRRHRDIHGQVRPDIWRSGIEHVRGMKIAAALATARPKGKRLPAAVVFVASNGSRSVPRPFALILIPSIR